MEPSRIGSTPIIKGLDLGIGLKGAEVLFKYEGANPTGTQKDRIAILHVKKARSLGYKEISVGTCGNYGAAIAYWADKCGLRAKIFVPKNFHPFRLINLGCNGFDIIREEGLVEDMIELSKAFAKENEVYDANSGSNNRDLDEIGYSKISEEIVQQLGYEPSFVLVPVGNGTTLSGIYAGFREMKRRGEIGSIPRIVAVGPADANPIIASIISGRSYADLKSKNIRLSSVNEPLAGYRSIDGEVAVRAVIESKGFAISVNDEEMISASHLFKAASGMDVLPAAASVIAALKYLPRDRISGKSIVCVLTGRGRL